MPSTWSNPEQLLSKNAGLVVPNRSILLLTFPMNRTDSVPSLFWRSLVGAAALLITSVAQAGQLDSGTFQPAIDETKGITLFAFDNVSIPFTRSLKLEMHPPEKYTGNPVLGRGKS